MRPVTNIKLSPGLADLVAAAGRKVGFTMVLSDAPISLEEMDMPDAAEAFDHGYHPDRLVGTYGSIRTSEPYDCDLSPFWNALNRLIDDRARAGVAPRAAQA